MTGWIKIHRELFDKPIWVLSSSEQKAVLITLLSMANYKEKRWEWNGQQYDCVPGQFITSLEKIAEKSGKDVSIQNVRTAIKRFEKYGFLTNESTKAGRLITIVNWGIYQVNDEEPNKDVDKDLTKSQQRPNKDLTTTKEYKELKEGNKEKEKDNTVLENTVRSTDVPQVIDAWNSLPGLSRIKKIVSGTQRYSWLKARIRDYGLDEVLRAVENVRNSPFLLGQSEKGWVITFDWFVRPNNFPKVLDGNYNDKSEDENKSNLNGWLIDDDGEVWQ